MNIVKIKGTNLELTDSLRDYLQDKLSDVDRFLQKVGGTKEAQVELAKTTDHHRKGKIYRAEIMVDIKGERIRAESTQEDIRAAIDEMKEEVSRQIKGYKEKKQTQSRKKSRWLKKLMNLSPLVRRGSEEEEGEDE